MFFSSQESEKSRLIAEFETDRAAQQALLEEYQRLDLSNGSDASCLAVESDLGSFKSSKKLNFLTNKWGGRYLVLGNLKFVNAVFSSEFFPGFVVLVHAQRHDIIFIVVPSVAVSFIV
jgi:hypothetical protein